MYLLISVVCLVFSNIQCLKIPQESTLEQVHVIFRHGHRTPDNYSYPTDPYINETFYPEGRGQLTLFGKKQEYQIGKNLRENYDLFLGSIYTDDIMEARSTDLPRTKMSLQLVLAGLWPPTHLQKWDKLQNWQPIPYLYDKQTEDRIMTFYFHCPNYLKKYNDVLNSPNTQEQLQKFQWVFDYANKYSGNNATTVFDITLLYFTLYTQEGLGLALPEWTNQIFPYALRELTIIDYILKTSTDEMLQTAIGGLMQKIRNDIESKMLGVQSKKLYLYSGHEFNVAFALSALNIFSQYPHVPSYGSYITIELHKINGKYGVKLHYNTYEDEFPIPVFIPDCDYFCPIEKFFEAIAPSSKNVVIDC